MSVKSTVTGSALRTSIPAKDPEYRVVHQENYDSSSSVQVATNNSIRDDDGQETQETQTIDRSKDRGRDFALEDALGS